MKKLNEGQGASTLDAGPFDLGDLVRREGEVPRQREAVGDVDVKVVGGKSERPGIDDRADGVVDRRLRLECLSAHQHRHRGVRLNGASIDQIPVRVERGLHVLRILLSNRRRAEPAAYAAAQGDGGSEPVAAGELPVRRGAEEIEVLEPDGSADGPGAIQIAQLEVSVDRAAVAVPPPDHAWLKPGKPFDPDVKPWFA